MKSDLKNQRSIEKPHVQNYSEVSDHSFTENVFLGKIFFNLFVYTANIYFSQFWVLGSPKLRHQKTWCLTARILLHWWPSSNAFRKILMQGLNFSFSISRNAIL